MRERNNINRSILGKRTRQVIANQTSLRSVKRHKSSAHSSEDTKESRDNKSENDDDDVPNDTVSSDTDPDWSEVSLFSSDSDVSVVSDIPEMTHTFDPSIDVNDPLQKCPEFTDANMSTPLRFREAHQAHILKFVRSCLADMKHQQELESFRYHHMPLFISGLNATGKTETIRRTLNHSMFRPVFNLPKQTTHNNNNSQANSQATDQEDDQTNVQTIYINAQSCTLKGFFSALAAKAMALQSKLSSKPQANQKHPHTNKMKKTSKIKTNDGYVDDDTCNNDDRGKDKETSDDDEVLFRLGISSQRKQSKQSKNRNPRQTRQKPSSTNDHKTNKTRINLSSKPMKQRSLSLSKNKALEWLFAWKLENPLLLVIDEIDSLVSYPSKSNAVSGLYTLAPNESGEEILSTLLRWLIHDPLKNQYLMLIGISNYSKFPKMLSPRLQREFEGLNLLFESYSVAQVKSILQSYHYDSPIASQLEIEDDVFECMARSLNFRQDGDIRACIDHWKSICSLYLGKSSVLTLDMYRMSAVGSVGWKALLKESRPFEIKFWKAVILEHRNSQLLLCPSSILNTRAMKQVIIQTQNRAAHKNFFFAELSKTTGHYREETVQTTFAAQTKTIKTLSTTKTTSIQKSKLRHKEVLCGRLSSVHLTMIRKLKTDEYQMSLPELATLLTPLQAAGILTLVYDISFSPSLFIHAPLSVIFEAFPDEA